MGHQVVSKQLFSLIYGGDAVHVAPQTRVLPAEDFSKLLTAEDLLARVDKDAEQYKREAVKECELLKEQAQREGFEAGFQQWSQHVTELEQEIAKVHDEVHQLMVPLAIKAARRIVGRELEVKPETVVDIIQKSLKAISQHRKIVIYVNPQELETVESERQQLRDVFERLESLSIRPRDDIDPGGCVIETEAGIINAQLDNQWQVLEKAFLALIKTEEEGA